MRKIKKVGDKTPPVGLEPTIFGLEVQRVIHYAMRAPQPHNHVRKRTLIIGDSAKTTLAHRGARTHDHQLKRLALYRLS